MDKKYNSNNLDKALNRMENADTLKEINRKSTNIMSFFDDNDKEHKLQKQQSAAELRKSEYLKKIELLKKIIDKKNNKEEQIRISSIGVLISTTDFLNLNPNRKKIIKQNMIWCNKKYKEYLDTLI